MPSVAAALPGLGLADEDEDESDQGAEIGSLGL
jgi:hypothetical protein